MKSLQISIPLGLGDLIIIKTQLDTVKHEYDLIEITPYKALYQQCLHTEDAGWPARKILWDKYLADVGKLFFSESPYKMSDINYPYMSTENMIKQLNLTPKKPELAHLLAKGKSLELDAPYIVLHTKARHINKQILYPNIIQLWDLLKKISNKYYIVIVGEKVVEMRKEYEGLKNEIFSLYEQMITNLPTNRVIDLTLPALSETVSDISQIQQDCLIIHEAAASITFGLGGNFCLSTAVAKMAIGFRTENFWLTNAVFTQEYSNAIITKDWARFMRALGRYL